MRGFRRRLCCLLALMLSVAGCRRVAPGTLEVVGQIEEAEIDEASGLAPSRTMPGVYWTHNDSGGKPVIYAIDTKGREVGRVRVEGVKNFDWEDIATFTRDGKNYIAIGEIGDNAGERANISLIVLEEPKAAQLKSERVLTLKPAWVQRVKYVNGPRDCESLAVDETGTRAYLLTKRDVPAVLYQVNLGPEFSEAVAQRIGEVKRLPQPGALRRTVPGPRGKMFGNPTAMSFSAEGRFAVVLTYGHLALFERQGTEPWNVTLGREPMLLMPHEILQAEAVCFIPGQRAVLATGEGVSASLYRWKFEP